MKSKGEQTKVQTIRIKAEKEINPIRRKSSKKIQKSIKNKEKNNKNKKNMKKKETEKEII